MAKPEEQARKQIDGSLREAGWIIQDMASLNVLAAPGVAVREYPLKTGPADYLLFVDGDPVGVLEAKPVGHTILGVQSQAEKYSAGLPEELDPPVRPLPFVYISTGAITAFCNHLDPDPRSREIFQIHRPETLREYLNADTLDKWVQDLSGSGGEYTRADDTKPSSLRSRLQTLPKSPIPGLWEKQNKAIRNLEESLKRNRPRALIQMATGSGKTLTTVAEVYRLIKFAGARRILFLVDRTNLGKQAEDEFAGYTTPDDHRKLTELYNVQRLQSNTIADSSRVVISTIQRMYSMLKGEAEFDPEAEEKSQYERNDQDGEPVPVAYNAAIPPEFFDIIIIDECHRSIYSQWRQVLEYFDAFLIGLTATPAAHTYGFFQQNLVMEYSHDEAVADGVNVDFEVYHIRTEISEQGATLKKDDGVQIGLRGKDRKTRWTQLDQDLTYTPNQLDRAVVAVDQIRTVLQDFKKKALP
ncbi:MAG: DEAD/DEAH box helicase family protein, partial [Leptospirales bacterium]